MARVITGYEGGRPVFRDEGPARGRVGDRGGGDTISRLGAQVLPTRFLTGGDATHAEQDEGGVGAIERRQMSDAERDARRRTDDAPSPIAPRRRETSLAASRARGAERAGFVKGATKPYLARPAPVTEPDPSPPPREEIAVVEAAQPPPLAAGTVSEESPRPRLGADVTTPCEDCVHAPVCRIRPELVPDQLLAFVEFEEGVRIAAISIDCDFYLAVPIEVLARSLKESVAKIEAGTPPPARVPVTEGGRRGRSVAEVTDREQRAANVIETLDRHGGDYTAAGRELGMRPNVVANIARTARRRAMFAGAAPAAASA